MTQHRETLKVIGYVLTTPWHNLKISVQNVIDIRENAQNTKATDEEKAWLANKKAEYNGVTVVGTLIASVVTTSISWPQTAQSHWIVLAAWYSALSLSLFSVIIAFYLLILVSTYETWPGGISSFFDILEGTSVGAKKKNRPMPRWSALYILQIPIMLLSYSIISYLVGLLVAVLEALWKGAFDDDDKIAIFFLVFFSFCFASFVVLCTAIYLVFLPNTLRNGPAQAPILGATCVGSPAHRRQTA